MFNPILKDNKGSKAMDMILSSLCMIMCNRVPKAAVTFRTDNLANKIKLVSAPKGIEIANRTVVENGVNEVQIEKNTNERAVVRILVPKRTMTLSEVNAEEQKREDEDKEGASPEKKEGEEAEKPTEKTEPDAAAEDAKA